MPPILSKKKYFYTEGHDVDGLIYRLKLSNTDNKELSRTPTSKRLIWQGSTANLGIKKYKRATRSLAYKDKQYLIDTFKTNVWKNSEMRDHIAKTALKAPKKTKKSKKKLDT